MATIQNRNYFFTIVPAQDRFRSGDEPTEQVMRDFLESVPFKNEVGDSATETQQGLVETATQAQFNAGIDNEAATGFSLYVKPSFIKTALDNITLYFNGLVNAINTQLTTITTNISNLTTSVNTLSTNVSNLTTIVGESMPLGSIIQYATITAPNTKWVICEGQGLSTASYPDLFTLVGYTYGGAGAIFNLPNYKHSFVAGYDSALPGYNALGVGGGQDTVTLLKSNLPTHQHTVNTALTDAGQVTVANSGTHTHNSIGSDVVDTDAGEITAPNLNVGGASFPDHLPAGDHTHAISGNTGNGTTDGLLATPFDNKPVYITMPYFIKALN